MGSTIDFLTAFSAKLGSPTCPAQLVSQALRQLDSDARKYHDYDADAATSLAAFTEKSKRGEIKLFYRDCRP
jgi:hypothetical protein